MVSSKLFFKGRVFASKRDHVVEPSGIEATREIVVHPGSVVVLPVLPDGRIVLIRQYRHAAGQYLWELVAGHKEEAAKALRSSARTRTAGRNRLHGAELHKAARDFPFPGLLGEKMEIFLAEGLTKGEAQPEDDEKSRRIFTLSEIERWIRAGRFAISKSVCGILYYAKFVARSN